MKKKIIGYDLVKPEYKKSVLELTNLDKLGRDNGKDADIGFYSTSKSLLIQAGVLDLWFIPVYEYLNIMPFESANLTVNYRLDTLKFTLSNNSYEITFDKSELEKIQKLYSLFEIELTAENLNRLLELLTDETKCHGM